MRKNVCGAPWAYLAAPIAPLDSLDLRRRLVLLPLQLCHLHRLPGQLLLKPEVRGRLCDTATHAPHEPGKWECPGRIPVPQQFQYRPPPAPGIAAAQERDQEPTTPQPASQKKHTAEAAVCTSPPTVVDCSDGRMDGLPADNAINATVHPKRRNARH